MGSGATMSGGCPSQFNACALTPLISNGTLDDRIAYLKKVYSKRAEAYATAMEEYWVPHGVQYTRCLGGYFIWVKLPPGLTATELSRLALEDGVWIMEGTNCMVPDDESVEYEHYIRICIALEPEDPAVEGIKRIGKIIEKLRQK
jgi:DNA-binding transcriptional MocR family regulator